MPTLHWLTRDDDVRAAHRTPYRLLEEVHDHSVGNVDSDNMLIQGDNLEALKALQPFWSGRVNGSTTDVFSSSSTRAHSSPTSRTPARSGPSAHCGNARAAARACSSWRRSPSMEGMCADS